MKINNTSLSQKVANFINKSPRVQNTLRKVDSNPALFNACYVALLSTTIKPSTILLLPNKTSDAKMDAKYAASKNIGTGILDLAIATMIFIPANKGLDRLGRKLFNEKNTVYFQNKQMCSNFKSVLNRFMKISLLPMFAWMKFNAIEPLSNILFKKDKRGNSN